MPDYKDSIKCKYCGHYEEKGNKCHLYYDYDSSLGGTSQYHKTTSPEDRCESFTLPSMDVIALSSIRKESGYPPRRKDGTYVVQLSDVPSLKAEFEQKKK